MPIEPGDGPAPVVAPMSILAQPMAFAGIDDQLAFHAPLGESRIELLGLAQRRAAVLAAMDNEGRRAWPVEAHHGRAVDGEMPVASFRHRTAHDVLAECVIAGIVGAP